MNLKMSMLRVRRSCRLCVKESIFGEDEMSVKGNDLIDQKQVEKWLSVVLNEVIDMVLHYPAMYPFRGMVYLAVHPEKWPHVLWKFLITGAFTIIVTLILFTFAFPAQAKGLSHLMSPWTAWTAAFFLTTVEVGTCVLIFTAVYQAIHMRRSFDAVWRQETYGITREEALKIPSPPVSFKKYFAILVCLRVLLYIVLSPLILIPGIGILLYICLNGYVYAWSLHCRYFDLIGLTFAQGRCYVENNRQEYIQFGLVAVFLEMIPLLNFVTPISNSMGGVLWASDIERFKDPAYHPRNYALEPNEHSIEELKNIPSAPPPTYQQSSSISSTPEKEYSLATVW